MTNAMQSKIPVAPWRLAGFFRTTVFGVSHPNPFVFGFSLFYKFFVLLKEAADIVGIKLFGGEWKSLGEICECYDGTHQTPKYTNGGIPFVSVQNIKNIYGTDKFISIEAFEEYKVKPEKNDLFMTRIGDIGTCALVENNKDLLQFQEWYRRISH